MLQCLILMLLITNNKSMQNISISKNNFTCLLIIFFIAFYSKFVYLNLTYNLEFL